MSDANALAREHTTEAIGRIVDVMRDEFCKPMETIAAAQALLDRGHGKPSQAIITTGGGNEGVPAKLAAMSDTELMAALGEARTLRQRQLPAIESTAVELDPLAL